MPCDSDAGIDGIRARAIHRRAAKNAKIVFCLPLFFSHAVLPAPLHAIAYVTGVNGT